MASAILLLAVTMATLFTGGQAVTCDVCMGLDYKIDSPFLDEATLAELDKSIADSASMYDDCDAPSSLDCGSSSKCYSIKYTLEMDIPDIMTMEVTTEGRGCAPRGMVDDSIYDAEICKRFDDIPGLIEMFPSMDEDSMTFGMESMGDSSVDVHGSLCVCDGGSCKEGGGSDKPNLPDPLTCSSCFDMTFDDSSALSAAGDVFDFASCDSPSTETCRHPEDVCIKASMGFSDMQLGGVNIGGGMIRHAGCVPQDHIPAELWTYGCSNPGVQVVTDSVMEDMGLTTTITSGEICLCDGNNCNSDVKSLSSVSGGGDGSGGWDPSRSDATRSLIHGATLLLTAWVTYCQI